MHGMVNAVLVANLGAEIHPEMNCQLGVIIDSASGGGRFHVRYVRGVWWTNRLRSCIHCIFLVNFHV